MSTTETEQSKIKSVIEKAREDATNSIQTILKNIFTNNTVTIIFWILAIYCLFYLTQSIFAPRGGGTENTSMLAFSRSVDILCLLLLVGVLAYYYQYKLTDKDKENIVGYLWKWNYEFFNNPYSVVESIVFMLVFFTLIYVFRVPMTPELKPVIVHIIEHKIWILFAIFAVIFFFKYALGIPIMDMIYNNDFIDYIKGSLKTYSTPAVSSTSKTSPSSFTPATSSKNSPTIAPTLKNTSPQQANTLKQSNSPQQANSTQQSNSPEQATAQPGCATPQPENNEAFNIGNNVYQYDEAQAVCKAYGARLATYDEIEKSYKEGGEWCNYGWSEGQMAYFPTQKDTWNKLQKDPKMKHACGRPGINGGFIDNPYVKFGANCFGKKPPKPDNWDPQSVLVNVKPVEMSEEDKAKAELIKRGLMNGFNANVKKWSEY